MRLRGKVAIVSGGSRGIGKAIARMFVEEGARVLIGDILEEEGRNVQRELGENCRFVRLDVQNSDDWKDAVDVATSSFGHLDTLVNNAGISDSRLRIEETSEQSWDKVMSINAKGVFLGTRSVIDQMRRAGGGSIVNVSSQFGIVGTDFENAAYQSSKGAIRIFTKVTALQYAKEKIRANSLHPGPIDTPAGVVASGNSERISFVLSKVPLGRIGTPKEVAYGVLFLASDESLFITGTELIVDGGWTAQ